MLIGKKLGMTRLFDESGGDQPVSVIHAGPCYVTQIKLLRKMGMTLCKLAIAICQRRR